MTKITNFPKGKLSQCFFALLNKPNCKNTRVWYKTGPTDQTFKISSKISNFGKIGGRRNQVIFFLNYKVFENIFLSNICYNKKITGTKIFEIFSKICNVQKSNSIKSDRLQKGLKPYLKFVFSKNRLSK